jgi:multimeric flavodoxin WrbA
MIEADGIILVSPVYFSMMSHKLNALTLYVARANNDLFKRKIGAAVVAVRRAGEIPTFDVMSHYS